MWIQTSNVVSLKVSKDQAKTYGVARTSAEIVVRMLSGKSVYYCAVMFFVGREEQNCGRLAKLNTVSKALSGGYQCFPS